MRPESTIERLSAGRACTIVALGDSLTQGWMVRKGYLSFIDEMIKEKYPASKAVIINRGIPGDTAEGGLYRLREDVLESDPHCVFIQFALNDAFIGVHPEHFKNNVKAIVETIKYDGNADILLVTSVYIQNSRENEMAEEFYSKLEELAGDYSLPIARVHEYWKKAVLNGIQFSHLVQYDGVHPTVEGYRLMAEAIMELF